MVATPAAQALPLPKDRTPLNGWLRPLACVLALSALAACSSSRQQMSASKEAALYASRAKKDYTAPGPASDPWGPYIVEAAARFDVPEKWVREVMRQESGGRLYENGQLITSTAGAMGLMQVMPVTYDELSARYGLGDDPFDPHNNVLAGTAYLREMYDAYGSPGFLAAYNAGPGRLEDYLLRNKGLPEETRRYVARIGANIQGYEPARASGSTQFAMLQLPVNIPAGPRYRPRAPIALADNRRSRPSVERGRVEVAALPEPPRLAPMPGIQMAAAEVPSPRARSGGFRLIPQAAASTMPARANAPTTGGWAIQVGAFGNEGQARAAADTARGQARDVLGGARTAVGTVRQASGTLFRARVAGLSRESAVQACEKLARGRGNCIVLSPDAQS
jgi:hypothetical protein